MVLFHEATTANLLECLFYHKNACDAADDTMVEVIDYAYRNFVWLVDEMMKNRDFMKEEDSKKWLNQKPIDELNRHKLEIHFKCAMSAFSMIRFVTDYMDDLPAPIIHQMIDCNDIPCALVPLLELKPWIR